MTYIDDPAAGMVVVGGLWLSPYVVCAHLGFFVGCSLALLRARAHGLAPQRLAMAFPVIYLGALAGSRLLSVLADGGLQHYVRHPLQILLFWNGGLVFYGGLFGGALAALAVAGSLGLSFRRCADACALGTCVGTAIGRVGCFLNGCCYGTPTNWPTGIEARNFALAPRPIGVPLHPSALYEAGLLMVVGFYLERLSRRAAPENRARISFLVFVSAYAVLRFAVEFTRADPRGAWGPLSTSQIIALATLALVILAKQERLWGRPRHAQLPDLDGTGS